MSGNLFCLVFSCKPLQVSSFKIAIFIEDFSFPSNLLQFLKDRTVMGLRSSFPQLKTFGLLFISPPTKTKLNNCGFLLSLSVLANLFPRRIIND